MSSRNLIEYLTTLNVTKLYNVLVKFLNDNGYDKIGRYPHFIIAEGDDPVCLIAHMDTVFSFTPEKSDFFYDQKKKMLWSPYGSGFDDRAGIAAIIDLVRRGHRPHIIFTDLEEKGGIGAHELVNIFPECPFKECKALIQLDRANEKDCVFYSCGNKYFERFINRYDFVTEQGTFSDISVIAPEWGIAATNLSVGYLDEHSYCERINIDWYDATVNKVSKIIEDISSEKSFKYIKRHYTYMPIYHINGDYCVFCGKKVEPTVDGHIIYDTDFPYVVCDDCYKIYYEGLSPSDDDEDDDIIPFN